MESKDYIIVFKDKVNSFQISGYIREVESAGGKLKARWDDSGILNGFAATIPIHFLEEFRTLQADDISFIEVDGIVTTL